MVKSTVPLIVFGQAASVTEIEDVKLQEGNVVKSGPSIKPVRGLQLNDLTLHSYVVLLVKVSNSRVSTKTLDITDTLGSEPAQVVVDPRILHLIWKWLELGAVQLKVAPFVVLLYTDKFEGSHWL